MLRGNRTLCLIGLVVTLAVLATAMRSPRLSSVKSSAGAIDTSKVVDLTYSFDEHTIYWPTAKPFDWHKESWGISPGGYWYAAARYAASEHGGTHIDSPIHFAEGKATVDEIPLSQLIGPVVRIDIVTACEKDPDYRFSVSDIVAWEKRRGRIAAGTIVFIHTGWGKYWPDKKRYLGSDVPGDTAHLHFPGISQEAAEFLVTKRRIKGVGIDTASLDYGPSKDFIAHRVLNGGNVYGLENVANMERVPVQGATIIALPMKIKGGSGAPTRITALLP